ncbi:toll-like receptor 6 [Ylistrum balloti]|uniref:toll-like receptor 6 n=1 Tax=Ylistrum balloti TaxID=509963 RepID=UPI002905BA8A|nr:toll-like receptor 6 [Ylistrum balloti]
MSKNTTNMHQNLNIDRKLNHVIERLTDKDCCDVYRSGETSQVTCQGCRLQAIPRSMDENTTLLDLSYNRLMILQKGAFITIPYLVHLSLSYNNLSVITTGAFDHLGYLQRLDLSHNALDDSSFKETTFQSLKNLRTLIIHSNNFNLRKVFPEATFLSLSNIDTLYIDIFDGMHFGKGFLNFKKLKNLHFYQNGELSIKNTTFQALGEMNIMELSLFFKTGKLESDALYPFQSLSSLVLDSRRYRDITEVLSLLYGLRESKMDSIRLSSNYVRNGGTVQLGTSDVWFLSKVCTKKLFMSDNAIGSINTVAFKTWASRGCIEYLDISKNSFQSPQVFFILKLFPSVKYIDCSYKKSTFTRKRKGLFRHSVYLPKTLIHLNLTHFPFTYDYGRLSFVEKNNLEVLDISYQLPSFTCGRKMYGLSHLTGFNISGIDCSSPYPEMFSDMLMLSTLTARECQLANSDLFYTNTLFKGLNLLSHVDLSSNTLTQLNSNTFTDQSGSLKTLLLVDNSLVHLPIEILQQLTVLEMLDISNNLIVSLTLSEINILDNYRSQSEKFTVKLGGNPLVCDCDNLAFLSWLDTTEVIYDKNELVCVDSNMKIVKLLETFHDFRVDCVSQFWLIVSITITVICLILGILFRVVWRYSLKLRFWCRNLVEHDTFPYDIFISYSRDDCGWIRKTLVPWLEQQDMSYGAEDKTFDTGLDICDNIMGAIDDSYQTVFVVSCKFLEYEWQTFAMKVASRYSFREGREYMNIIILLDDIKQSEFPKMIRENWDKIRPLHWPDLHNTDGTRLNTARKLFWEKLLKRIRKGNKRLAKTLNSESTV